MTREELFNKSLSLTDRIFKNYTNTNGHQEIISLAEQYATQRVIDELGALETRVKFLADMNYSHSGERYINDLYPEGMYRRIIDGRITELKNQLKGTNE